MATDKDTRTLEIVLKAQDANASLKEMAAGAAVMNAQLSKMGQDDPGRAKLLGELQVMNGRLAEARTEMRQVIKTEEELAAEALTAAAAVEALARANEQTVTTGRQASASLNEMRAAASLMEQELAAMSQQDPGRAALQQDFAQLSQRIGETTAAMRRQVQTEEELREAQARLAAENVRVVVNGQRVNASFNEMTASATLLEQQLHELSADDPGRARLLADYRALQQRIGEVRTEMGHTTQEGSKFKQMLGLVGVAFTAEAAIEGITSMGKAIFDTTAKFEKYGAVLATALGSESAAQLALHDIQTMAAQTPFSVDELTASFIKFVNRGLQPSMADMTKMADLAASQGKSFEQLTEAVLDAGTGEFERLKEFGIQASKSGNQVELSFKGVQKTVANTPEAINAALLTFGELKGVMGSTAAISETLEGQVSNLGDTADQVAIQYGQGLKPVFVAVISTIGFFLGLLMKLPGFVVENRGALLALAGAVMTFNAPMIQANALLLYNAALSKGKVIWDGAVAASTKAWEIAQLGLNLALSANPIGAVIAVGTLLVGLFIMLYDKSEKVRAGVSGLGAAFMAFVTTLKNGVLQNLAGIGDVLVGIFTANPEKIKKGLAEIGGSLKTIYYDAGKNAGAAFNQGYDERMKAEAAARGQRPADAAAEAEAARKKAAAAAKAKAEAEAAAHLVGLKTEEANLKVRLAQAEDGSRQEMKLKQQLIGVQAKIELADAKKSEDDKRVIRAESLDKMQDLERSFNQKKAKEREDERMKLEKLAEDAAKKELALQRSIEDLQVSGIKDKYAREIAEIDLQTNRKMAAVEGSEEQIMAQWEVLEQARQDKIAAVNAKKVEDDLKLAEEDMQRQVEAMAANDEVYAAELALRFEQGLQSEQEYNDALFELKQAGLRDQLELVRQLKGEESNEYKRINAQIIQGEAAKVKKEKDLQEDLRAFNTKMAATAAGVLAGSLSLIEDHLNKKSAAYTSFRAARKAAELAELGINLYAELQHNSKAASENPLNGITAGAAGATQLFITNGLSIVRAAAAGAKIAAFKDGGNTSRAKDLIDGRQALAMLSGASGGSQAPGGSFAGGGPVGKATIGLIGEAGPELVIPNWMYADPKQADLMGFLEAQIASRGNAFAGGGSTVKDYSASQGGRVGAGDETMATVLSQMVQVLGQLDNRLEGVEEWQRSLEVNNNLHDTKRGLEVINQIQNGGGVRIT